MISYRNTKVEQYEEKLMQQCIKQLGNLFIKRTFQYKDGFWITTTFIDGSKGIFRYDYYNDSNSTEKCVQSSSTIFPGYWIMLRNGRINDVCKDIRIAISLPNVLSNLHFDGGITFRGPNPMMDKGEV